MMGPATLESKLLGPKAPGFRLEARNLSVGYHGKASLCDVSLGLKAGELLALIGPNGVGKTTLLRTLAGLTKPLSGTVYLDDLEVSKYSKGKRAQHLAFLSQGLGSVWPFTVKELVSQGRFAHRGWFGNEKKKDTDAVLEALERSGLQGFEDRLITELSGGELQRAMIARCIAQEPDILLLDEPVSQLDLKYQSSAMDLVRELTGLGMAAALTMHDLNLASLYADRIALFSQGSLLAIGSPQEVLKEELLSEAFGTTMLIGSHPEAVATPSVFHPSPRQ
ncbi:ABC transporter ATP-binding protein [Treponema sp.]